MTAASRGGLERARTGTLLRLRVITYVSIFGPLVGLAAAIAAAWEVGLRPAYVGAFAIMYALGVIGITVGNHRLFSHRAFVADPWLRALLAILGSMSAQGSVLFWVATHRHHHKYSDVEGDSHSPNLHGSARFPKLAGLWHAHVGWMLELDPKRSTELIQFVPDLLRDRTMLWISRTYGYWVALGIALPAAAVGLIEWSWTGVLMGALWGGLARLCASQHATWSVNSITHMFGRRPFRTRERSRNSALLALPTFGEAWHNNHHAFPSSAYLGLTTWQLDPGAWFIDACRAVGWITDVHRPTEIQMSAKRD